MNKQKGKVVKSIYMDEKAAKRIEKKAQEERRNFSFIANEILNQWVIDQMKGDKK